MSRKHKNPRHPEATTPATQQICTCAHNTAGEHSHLQESALPGADTLSPHPTRRDWGLSLSHTRMLFCLLWTAVFLWLLATGDYTAFLRPEFGVLLVAGGLILTGSFFASRNSSNHQKLDYPGLLRLLILLLPILFLLRGNGSSLDGYALNREASGLPTVRATSSNTTSTEAPSATASISDSPAGVFGQLPPGTAGLPLPDPSADANREIRQALKSAGSEKDTAAEAAFSGTAVTLRQLFTDADLYTGKRVVFLGMVNRNEEVCRIYGEQARLVFRFYFTCCAACAQPLPVVVRSGLEHVPDNQWVCISGVYQLEADAQDRKVPLLQSPTFRAVTPPAQPYLY